MQDRCGSRQFGEDEVPLTGTGYESAALDVLCVTWNAGVARVGRAGAGLVVCIECPVTKRTECL